MTQSPEDGVSSWSAAIRKWAIRIGIALLVFEVFYVVAANIFIRTDLLTGLINKKPEKTHISWESATTYLPGVATVKGFTLRSQTKKDQIYLHVVEAKARISLLKLAMKTIHIRGADAKDADFRYRQRLDRPPKAGQEDEPQKPATDVEYWPEIPGWSNPPDPKPEALYPMKKKKRPWTIKITGAHVEGPIKVALNEIRINGDGWAGGGVTVKPRQTIKIHRGKLQLEPATVVIGPDIVTNDLKISADVRIDAFPAKGAKAPDVLGGISGTLELAGELGERAAVRRQITPGMTVFGAGTLKADLRFKKGILRAGSTYSLQSDDLSLRIMNLDANGSATVSGSATKDHGDHVTDVRVDFDGFQFAEAESRAVDVVGSGLEVTARWNGFSIGEWVPAENVTLVLPPTQINDISVFNALLPEESTFALESGTGTVESKIEVANRVAVGTLDLVADEIVMRTRDIPLAGDIEVHANLTEGDLPAGEFDLSGTTIRVDDIVGRDLTEKQKQKIEAWFCEVGLQKGHITFGKPMAASGSVKVKMYDTRPLVALLKDMGSAPKWLSMAPNVKNVDGTAELDFGKGFMELDNIDLTGKGLQILGTIKSRDKKTDGRLYIKYKGFAAGIGIDQGKAKMHLAKPRKWFEGELEPAAEPGS